jgi:lipocalin
VYIVSEPKQFGLLFGYAKTVGANKIAAIAISFFMLPFNKYKVLKVLL